MRHFLGVTGDEVLISFAMVRTSYVPAVLCRKCGFAGFISGSENADDAEAIVDDALSVPEGPVRPSKG